MIFIYYFGILFFTILFVIANIIRHVFHNTWNELGISTSMKDSMRIVCVCVCVHRAAFLLWIFARSKSVGLLPHDIKLYDWKSFPT